MAWLVPLVLLAFAACATLLLVTSRSARKRALRDLKAALAARGLRAARPTDAAAGDAALLQPNLGIVLERGDGVQVTYVPLGAAGVAVPGFGPGASQTVVELPLALPDQLICSPQRAQAAFGPFPPPPLPSGDRGFDQQFAIYLRPDASPAYRGGPADAAPWVRGAHAGPLLATLRTLGFEALHVQAGRARAVFAPLPIDGMVRALEASLGFARAVPVPAVAMGSALRPSAAGAVVVGIIGALPTLNAFLLITELVKRGSELGGYSVVCPDGGTYRPSFKSRRAQCTAPNGAALTVNEGAYDAWGTLAGTSYCLGVLLLAFAVWHRSQARFLRGVSQRLAPG